jgi:hypothetical protein
LLTSPAQYLECAPDDYCEQWCLASFIKKIQGTPKLVVVEVRGFKTLEHQTR